MTIPIEKMDASWLELLSPEFEKPMMLRLRVFLADEIRAKKTVFPPDDQIFSAFCQTPFDETKVVIVGQDPYHGEGQANGLCFSVPKDLPVPPSLQNIFKELGSDVGMPRPSHGFLLSWAEQGILLLNATLTVRENEPKSHFGKGWEEFTDRVIQLLAARRDPLVFILWGKAAQEKWKHVSVDRQQSRHLVLIAAHPSPLSAYAGFFGCRHFSKTNEFLIKMGKEPIDWTIN